jgi:DNA-3-methyladenine glycosylase
MAVEGRRDQRLADLEAGALPAEGPSLSRRRLPRSFFARSAVEVAPELLGRTLVRRTAGGSHLAARIVETEAYEPTDPASHSYVGMTPRNATMFGPPGHLYVYFAYGNHWMMNVVTGPSDVGSAVLLRAAEPLEGVGEMRLRRGREGLTHLCSGPGKLAQAFGVDRGADGADLVRGDEMWIEAGTATRGTDVIASTRIGISVGIEEPWRFRVRDDPFVSPGRRRRSHREAPP